MVILISKQVSVMKKIWILLVMAMLMVASCNEKKNFETLNGEWKVVTIGDMSVPESVDAFIGFNTAEQVVYGSTGCNYLTGAMPTELNSETLMFGAMGSTRMMCADMAVEDAMLPALAKVVDFKVNGNNLNLLDVDGNIVISLEKR
jgi:heat shock protein HslJ